MKKAKILTTLLATMLVSSLAFAESQPLAVVEKDGLQGCINTKGKVVIPLEFKHIDIENGDKGDLVAVEGKGKIGIYHRDGSVLYPVEFDKVNAISENTFAAKKNGKWSFYDLEGNTLASGFDDAGSFKGDLAPVKEQGKWGYINKKGEAVIPYAYKEARNFSEGVAAVKQEKLWGYITEDGVMAINPTYKKAHDFHEGLALVNGKTFVDVAGMPVLHANSYNYVGDFNKDGIATVGLRIRNNSFLDFVSIGWIFGDWGPWWDSGWGWAGSIFVDPSSFDRGSMHRGYIDQKGHEIISPENSYVGEFIDGLAIVGNKGKWGMNNTEGQVVIPHMYEKLMPFSNGLAAFQFSKKWGFIDESNAMVIQNKFDGVTPFYGDYASAVAGGRGGIIDKTGKFIFDPLEKYKEIGTLKYDRAPVKVDGKWGYITTNGVMSIKPEYDKAGTFR